MPLRRAGCLTDCLARGSCSVHRVQLAGTPLVHVLAGGASVRVWDEQFRSGPLFIRYSNLA